MRNLLVGYPEAKSMGIRPQASGVRLRQKTGPWVGKNWLTFVRLSKFCSASCKKEHSKSSKYGVDDMSRMVACFHTLVVRCLTNSSIDDDLITEVELCIKEFMSCVREFDVRVRYAKLDKSVTKVSERKGTEAWWLKSNYMSLPNLVATMILVGPLVLWWDGGGKGERFIQTVKPHIKRGVRGDLLTFFVRLLEKLFKGRLLDLMEGCYSSDNGENRRKRDPDP